MPSWAPHGSKRSLRSVVRATGFSRRRAIAGVASGALALGLSRAAFAQANAGANAGTNTATAASNTAAPVKEDTPEEVTVRGTQVGGFVNRVTEGETVRPSADAASLFEGQAGVHVRRLGADNTFSTLLVRGAASNQLMIVLAGIPLTSGADPALNLSSLPIWPGARVRVYRTFAPASLGPGSLGGTLSIDAPKTYGGNRTEIFASLGSFGAARNGFCVTSDVRIPVTREKYARSISCISASRGDGAFEYLDPIASASGTPTYTQRQNAENVDLSALAQRSTVFQIGGFDGRYLVTGLSQDRKQELPGTVRAPSEFLRVRSSRGAIALELDADLKASTAMVRFWLRRDRTALRDAAKAAQLSQGPTETRDNDIAMGLSLAVRPRLWEGAQLASVLDIQAERFAPGQWRGAPQPQSAKRFLAGGGFEFSQTMGDLALLANGRFDHWEDQQGDPDAKPDASRSSARATGYLGAEYTLSAVKIAAHGGRTARPPSFLEMFGNRGAFLGNPALKAEGAWSLDAGANLRLGKGGQTLEAEVGAFATFADDLIVFVPQGAYGRSRATNIGSARILGAETALRARFEALKLQASYTFLASQNNSSCAAESSNVCVRPELPGRPAHDLSLDISYVWGIFQAHYGLDVVAGIRADLDGAIRVPARVLQSAGAKLDFPKPYRVSVTFDIRNLGDVREGTYQGLVGPVLAPIGDAFDYPLPGRTFLLGMRFIRDFAL
jgi:vitamin B12 transporter